MNKARLSVFARPAAAQPHTICLGAAGEPHRGRLALYFSSSAEMSAAFHTRSHVAGKSRSTNAVLPRSVLDDAIACYHNTNDNTASRSTAVVKMILPAPPHSPRDRVEVWVRRSHE